MPALEGLKQKYAGQGLGVIGIVIDSQNTAAAADIANRAKTSFPHLLDDGKFGKLIFGVPQTFLVDGSGKILKSISGARTQQQFEQIAGQYLK
ncbi:MAG: TlpA family protein disulfide reductase [Firmicutes bacterium]|nr:TlpA family protein disulfide reductase [Bacillota bacterium]